MTYTTYNQSKTVAINIARGVIHYMERLDFQTIAKYTTDHITQQTPFVRFDASSCSNSSLFPNEMYVKLFFHRRLTMSHTMKKTYKLGSFHTIKRYGRK